jgi:hypothetical protein
MADCYTGDSNMLTLAKIQGCITLFNWAFNGFQFVVDGMESQW